MLEYRIARIAPRQLAGDLHGGAVALECQPWIAGLAQCFADFSVKEDEHQLVHPARRVLIDEVLGGQACRLEQRERRLRLVRRDQRIAQLKVKKTDLLAQTEIGGIGFDELADIVARAARQGQARIAVVRLGSQNRHHHVGEGEIGLQSRIVRVRCCQPPQDGACGLRARQRTFPIGQHIAKNRHGHLALGEIPLQAGISRLRCRQLLVDGERFGDVVLRLPDITLLPQRKADAGEGIAELPLQVGIAGVGHGEPLDQGEPFTVTLKRRRRNVSHRIRVDQ